jgi:branched-chain amino acid transport system substrate-binding protein
MTFTTTKKLAVLAAATAILAAACSSGNATTAPAESQAAATAAPAESQAAATAAPAESAAAATCSGKTISLGGLATLEGPFAVPGQDGFRGIEQALNTYAKVPGKDGWWLGDCEITLTKEGSDATPAVALEKAKKLIEQDNVDILIGPLSGDEGLAMKDYAKTVPDKTFVNGSSAAQDTTFRDPAPNFYRFSTDGAQWQAGLGKYAFDNKGYKNVALVAEDYSFPYTQVGGFMYEFCAAGGHVVQKNWVPLGTKDYSSVVSNLPTSGIDAIYVALGGSDAVNFFTQYQAAGGKAKFIGGSITVDQSVLATEGAFADSLVGTITASPTSDTAQDPSWLEYVKAYHEQFPDGLPYPGLFALSYYNETVGVLKGLQAVNGDLSDGQKKFMEALAKVEFDGPTGHIALDSNRQAIGPNYVSEIQKGADGKLAAVVIDKAENVPQTLGLPADSPYLAQPVSRDFPSCP